VSSPRQLGAGRGVGSGLSPSGSPTLARTTSPNPTASGQHARWVLGSGYSYQVAHSNGMEAGFRMGQCAAMY
jgi:hypothetical protein